MNKENRIRLLAFMLSLITTMASPVTAFAAEASVVTEGLGATGYSSPLLETVDSDSGETPGDSGNGNTKTEPI